ncbi:hypothetical protein FGIG_02612 [Fasciola gigantica]|uniref:Uncharacterized protein n=1 Tax=Fasciola gigantica TaxID=46835 RepID=A0A504Y5K6_FASGI|nr:hypothetical protein FGIG_02612 [Fasciola gigantica]
MINTGSLSPNLYGPQAGASGIIPMAKDYQHYMGSRTTIMSNNDDFKFDFALDVVAADWRREDLVEPDEDDMTDRQASDTKANSVQSFFETQIHGNAYFTITDPVKIKQEWIINRRAVKSDIQSEVRMLVRKKLHNAK